ncbi:MAG: ABC transporter permease [Clostridiales bacterium]|nr:ABC transporter permease [Clostridiales bacterium]
MISFSIRNLKVFFKDRTSVFFSLLAVFIIIGLYALFLGDVWTSSFEGLTGVRYLMDSWIMAGLLAVTSVTTTMGAYGIMVDDKAKKINKDFIASPVRTRSIVGGYVTGAIIVGIIMSFVACALAEIYVISNGGRLMDIFTFIKVSGLIILSTITSSSIIFFVVSFFKSNNAFATASTIIGTVIGFLTGIYLPIGQLPSGVQWVIKVFPVSHAASLFRQVMMEDPISRTFAEAPAESVANFEKLMGVKLFFGDTAASPLVSILILVVTAAIFYMLAIFNVSRKTR